MATPAFYKPFARRSVQRFLGGSNAFAPTSAHRAWVPARPKGGWSLTHRSSALTYSRLGSGSVQPRYITQHDRQQVVTAIPSFAAANFFQATVKIPFWNISQFTVGQFDRVDTQPSIIHIECTMGNVIVAWWRFDTNVHTSPGFNQSGPTTITTASSSPPSSETPVKSRIPGGGRYQPITAALIVELYNVGGGPSNPGNLVVDVGCHVVYQPR